jgi:hypothetical protein
MVGHLVVAAKVAGLTYRVLSSTTMIGLLIWGVVETVRAHKKK